MNTELSQTVLDRLSELRSLCPDMRFGQIVATLGLLAEDDPGRSLWDVEDGDLACRYRTLSPGPAASRANRRLNAQGQ